MGKLLAIVFHIWEAPGLNLSPHFVYNFSLFPQAGAVYLLDARYCVQFHILTFV
jgi:hypothetical protein